LAEKTFRPKDSSIETLFRSEYLSAKKMLPDEKISVRIKLDTEIEGIVRVSFDLTFKGSDERVFGRKTVLSTKKKISSAEKMIFGMLETRLSRKCNPPSLFHPGEKRGSVVLLYRFKKNF
jgi:hypothetical protein